MLVHHDWWCRFQNKPVNNSGPAKLGHQENNRTHSSHRKNNGQTLVVKCFNILLYSKILYKFVVYEIFRFWILPCTFPCSLSTRFVNVCYELSNFSFYTYIAFEKTTQITPDLQINLNELS